MAFSLELCDLIDPKADVVLVGENHTHYEGNAHLNTQWCQLRTLGFDTYGIEESATEGIRGNIKKVKAAAEFMPDLAMMIMAASMKGAPLIQLYEQIRPGIVQSLASHYVSALGAGLFLEPIDHRDCLNEEERHQGIARNVRQLIEEGRKPVIKLGAKHIFEQFAQVKSVPDRLIEEGFNVQTIILAGAVVSRANLEEDFTIETQAWSLGKEKEWFAQRPRGRNDIYFHIPSEEDLSVEQVAERIVLVYQFGTRGAPKSGKELQARYWQQRLEMLRENRLRYPPFELFELPDRQQRAGISLSVNDRAVGTGSRGDLSFSK